MTAPRRLNTPLQEVPKPEEEPVLRTRPKILPAPDLVDSIIQQGVARRASDIHLEPIEHGMNDIISETINIVTIEDPIEYEMAGVTQIGVNDRVGLTFASCLRSVLRQDPDVILVGEVRDLETARIAMQASLTGHLVFATLHTNDAVGAITRLADMEIPRYLIASSMTAVLAQRLVRRLCPDCKVGYEPDAATRMLLHADAAPLTLFRAEGCASCHSSGVIGRTAIFEMVPITEDLRVLINDRGSEADLRACARGEGARSLFQDGARKVLDGTIALEELKRVAEPDRL